MVFQGENHATLCSQIKALLDRVNAPFKSFILGVPGEDRLFAAGFHKIIEGLDRVPSAGIKPDARNPHLIRQFNTLEGVIDVPLPLLRLWIHKILVD